MTKLHQPYPTYHEPETVLYGRQSTMGHCLAALTKQTADNLAVIGPPHIGKTTFLRALGDRLLETDSRYHGVVLLDLRRHTVTTENSFFELLAHEVIAEVKRWSSPFEAYLEFITPGDEKRSLQGFFDILATETGQPRILIVLDGLDSVLKNPEVTPNLWEALRDLVQKSSCVMITGSRAPLLEICANEDSRNSPFWNNFAEPRVRLRALDESDMTEVLAPLEAHGGVSEKAQKELIAWTGGHPALVSMLCRVLADAPHQGTNIQKGEIERAAQEYLESTSPLLYGLHQDCSEELRGALYRMATQDPAAPKTLSHSCYEEGKSRGFIEGKQGSVTIACRLIEHHVQHVGGDTLDVARLFGTAGEYKRHVSDVLRQRLRHVPIKDRRLRKLTERVIDDLADDPIQALTSVRGIVNRALDLIWEKELIAGDGIPSDWIEKWQELGLIDFIDRYPKRPDGLGAQCALLRVILGQHRDRPPILAEHVTQPTQILIDFLQSIGNLGQHSQGQSVSVGYVAAVGFAIVELLDRLAHELVC